METHESPSTGKKKTEKGYDRILKFGDVSLEVVSGSPLTDEKMHKISYASTRIFNESKIKVELRRKDSERYYNTLTLGMFDYPILKEGDVVTLVGFGNPLFVREFCKIIADIICSRNPDGLGYEEIDKRILKFKK